MSLSSLSFPPLIALVGPTGVGKTALAIALAQHFGGEIVGADSRQVYRAMAIGTAKPTPAEQAAAPHHLIDMVDPDEPWSLAMYCDAANASIAAITQRDKLPLLVGGTGQYLQAILEGWQIPRVAPHWELRAQWEALAARDGGPALHRHLAMVDPVAAAAIQPNNVRRMVRALEVFAVSGQPISQQQLHVPPPYRRLTIWLDQPHAQLYPRLDTRVEQMIASGLVEEVASLLARGYDWSLPAMASLGYREWQPYFNGTATIAECTTRLMFNTHNFVRKQSSWFRRLPRVEHVAAGADAFGAAVDLIDRCRAERG